MSFPDSSYTLPRISTSVFCTPSWVVCRSAGPTPVFSRVVVSGSVVIFPLMCVMAFLYPPQPTNRRSLAEEHFCVVDTSLTVACRKSHLGWIEQSMVVVW